MLLGGAREAAIILAFLTLGSAGTRTALVGALVLGLLLEFTGHLPWSAITLPGCVLVAALTLLHPWLIRRAWALRAAVAAAGALTFTGLLPLWFKQLGLPAIDAHWFSALIASALWVPLVMLASPPDTAI